MTTNEFISQIVLTKLQETYDHLEWRSILPENASPFSASLKEFVEQASETCDLSPGEILFLQDADADSLYWIESGVLAILQGELKNPFLLTYRHPGQVVGEIALIENISRTASTVAIVPTRLRYLDKERFQELLARVPGVGIEIMRLLSSRLREIKPAEYGSGFYDHLTGALSRRALDGRLQEEIARARRYKYSFSLVFIDLDDFKEINDNYGHARGDEALVTFVQRTLLHLRATDLLFRYGGDEFILLLQGVDPARGPALLQRLLAESLENPVPGVPPVHVSFSAGTAYFPDDGETPTTLLKIADQRLYQAKGMKVGLVRKTT
jgi:diguanylate cyclase (GGDEF)-like protein